MDYLLGNNILLIYGRNRKLASSIKKIELFNGVHELALSA